MKKVYTIQINDIVHKPGIWYYKRTRERFNAILRSTDVEGYDHYPVIKFMIDDVHYVDLIDCTVISETVISRTAAIPKIELTVKDLKHVA